MLLALALYASIAHAGIPAGFGGTPGVVSENTPQYDLALLYHDGKAQSAGPRLASRPGPLKAGHVRVYALTAKLEGPRAGHEMT